MTKFVTVIFITVVFNGTVPAQDFVQWKNYSNMQNVRASKIADSTVWCATSGGIFSYNFSTGEYRTFTQSEGLSSQDISCLTIDKLGRIWVGASTGVINILNPANGDIEKILDIQNSDKTQKGITDLTASGDTVFAASEFGLSLIEINSLFFLETVRKFGTMTTEIKVLSVTAGSRIFVSTTEGIAVSKTGATNLSAPEMWDNFQYSTMHNVKSVYKILKKNSDIFAASNNGLLKFSGGAWQIESAAGMDIIDLTSTSSGLNLITSSTLFSYNNSLITILYDATGYNLSKIVNTGTGGILLASDGGILNTTDDSVIYPNGPAANTFSGMDVYASGNVWVGGSQVSSSKGVYKFDGSTWSIFNKDNVSEFKTNQFFRVYASPQNEIFLANWGHGFTRYSNGTFHTFDTYNTPMNGILDDPLFLVVSGIMNDSKGNTWILNYQSASREHLSVLTKDNLWYNYKFDSPLISNEEVLDHLTIDRFDTKWFSVFVGDKGLYYFNENGTFDNLLDDDYGYISTADGLNSNFVTALATDNRGEVWVGTNLGVNVISSPSNPRASISNVRLLTQQSVTCIAVDPLDRKWIGTTQGVIVLTPDGSALVQHINTKYTPDGFIRPLPNDDIRSIAIDETSGWVYIGTDFGMTSVKTSAVKAKSEITDLIVSPNPFIPESNGLQKVQITNLIKNTQIKIISISGKVINDSEIGTVESPGGSIAYWDARDFTGSLVPSGIYIVVAYDEEAKNVAYSKIAVINK